MAGTFTWTNLLATVHCTSTSADSQAQLCHYQQIHFYMNTLTGDYSNYVSKMAPGRRLKIRTITERDEEITLGKHCNALPIKHQLTMNWTSLANERAQLTNEKCSTLCSQFVSKYCLRIIIILIKFAFALTRQAENPHLRQSWCCTWTRLQYHHYHSVCLTTGDFFTFLFTTLPFQLPVVLQWLCLVSRTTLPQSNAFQST